MCEYVGMRVCGCACVLSCCHVCVVLYCYADVRAWRNGHGVRVFGWYDMMVFECVCVLVCWCVCMLVCWYYGVMV